MDFDRPGDFDNCQAHAKSKDTLHKEQLKAKLAEINALKGRLSLANQQNMGE